MKQATTTHLLHQHLLYSKNQGSKFTEVIIPRIYPLSTPKMSCVKENGNTNVMIVTNSLLPSNSSANF